MAAAIDLTIEKSVLPAPASTLTGCETDPFKPYVVSIAVSRNVEIPAHIFVMSRESDGTDTFCTVATISDMDNIPAGSPASGSVAFRVSEVEVSFATIDELNAFADEVVDLSNQLVLDWDEWIDDFSATEVSLSRGS